jgi:hypothetical protein
MKSLPFAKFIVEYKGKRYVVQHCDKSIYVNSAPIEHYPTEMRAKIIDKLEQWKAL